jgi:hypothetical protein
MENEYYCLYKDVSCIFCNDIILNGTEGHSYLDYKGKAICCQCSVNLSQTIYEHGAYIFGGIIHYVFVDLVQSRYNRKRRKPMYKRRETFQKLLLKYNFKCVKCNALDKLTIDHIKPVKLGGSDDYENLQILCRSCNSKKGVKTNDQW